MASATHNFSDNKWIREIRVAKCKNPQNVLNNVNDECDMTKLDSVYFLTSNDTIISLSLNVGLIHSFLLQNKCKDISWDDGTNSLNGNAKLHWIVSYNAIKPIILNNTNFVENMCIEQKYVVDFASNIYASASFSITEELSEFVKEVRVIKSDMLKCIGQDSFYKLSYDVLISLKSNPNNGLYGYVPYAVKPQNSKCHFESHSMEYDSSLVHKLSDTIYIIKMSTDCKRVKTNECNRFHYCADSLIADGINDFGMNVVFKRGNNNLAIASNVDISLKHTECIGDESFLYNITGTVEIWREKENTYEMVNEIFDFVEVNKRYFVVMTFESNGLLYTTEKTKLTNVDGYNAIANSGCSDCSYTGCKSDIIASHDTFGAFVLNKYGYLSVNYIWHEFVPNATKDTINLKIETVSRGECETNIENIINNNSSQIKVNIHGEIKNVKVMQQLVVLYDLQYTELIHDNIENDCRERMYESINIPIISCKFSEASTKNTYITFETRPSYIKDILSNLYSDTNALYKINTELNAQNILDTSIEYNPETFSTFSPTIIRTISPTFVPNNQTNSFEVIYFGSIILSGFGFIFGYLGIKFYFIYYG
jgi:hypothetical protein